MMNSNKNLNNGNFLSREVEGLALWSPATTRS